MTIQKLPGAAIVPGTITVTQLDSSTATVISTGGGPKITAIAVTDNAYTVLDDTAVDTGGGYIKITGTGFVTGCSVIIGTLPASSVSFISSTEVRVQVGAQVAGTYIVYLVNPDGGVGIRVNGLTYSANPAWQTASGLPDQYDGVAISLSLVATDATSYTITSGSLPPGLSLAANTGVISGTVTGVANDTTYTFTVRATDAQNQDSPRTFTVTITLSDPYFRLTTLLLGGEQGNTVVRDSSVNNFNLTVYGDSRASNFTPYNGGYSMQFSTTGDYLTLADNEAWTLGNSNFSLEVWIYPTAMPSDQYPGIICHRSSYTVSNGWGLSINIATSISFSYSTSGDGSTSGSGIFVQIVASDLLAKWSHIVVTRSGNQFRMFINGQLRGTLTNSDTIFNSTTPLFIGRLEESNGNYFTGYISNVRLVKGSIPVEYQTSSTTVGANIFTPPTQTVTAVSGTQLLACHTNTVVDSSVNNFAINRFGNAAVRSANSFGITNTGDSGSMYFDGTGDYLTVPDNVNLEPLGGNFTIEAWFYLNAVTAGTQICGKSWWSPFYIEGANLVTYLSSNGSTWDIASNQVIITSVATLRWYHVAMVRNGTSIKAYVNGKEALSLTTSAALHDGSDSLTIAARGSTYLNGYVSDLRFVKGSAVYTANFTPSTTSLTAIANTQLLTLQYRQPHNNHSFQDSSSNQFLITRNGNASQGTFSPFSQTGWSYYFNGSSWISSPSSSAFAIGTNLYTIEFWAYFISTPNVVANSNIFGVSATGGWILCAGSTTIFVSNFNIGTTVSATYTAPLNTWLHIAVARGTANSTSIWVNGTRLVNSTDSYNYAQGLLGIGGNPVTNNQYITGYISNGRIVIGVDLYGITNATITVPTSPLTSVSGTTYLTAQSNRLKDNSSNNASFSTGGSPSVQAWSPFAPTAVYTPAVHGGSAYFDGTGDVLSFPSSVRTAMGGGFAGNRTTMEVWIYTSATSGTIIGRYDGIAENGRFYWTVVSQNLRFGYTTSPSSLNTVTSTGARVIPNQWNHVAITIDATSSSSSTIKMFINGILSDTFTGQNLSTHSVFAPSNPPAIGISTADTGNFSGYMSGFRFTAGLLLYTVDFSLPTAPLTADTNTALLLNFTNPAILDRTGRVILETVGDAKSSSVQVKYGTGAMYFDGSGDRLTIPATPYLTFGTGDFTIEMWIYSGANGGTTRVMGNGAGSTWAANKWVIGAVSNFFFAVNNYSNSTSMMTSTTAAGDNAWHHLAITRSGNIWRLFVDGVQQATVTSSVSMDGGVSATIDIGRSGVSSDADWTGYLDDLRVTQGFARYTVNFTPTGPHRLK